MKLKNRIVALAAFMLCGAGAFAQVPASLTINADASSMAMGGAGLAMDANAFTASETGNAAAITLTDKTMSAGVNYMMYLPSDRMGNFAGAGAFYRINDRWGVALNGRYLGDRSLNMDNVDGMFSPSDFSVSAGVSFKILEGFSVGANLKYVGYNPVKGTMVSAFSADISLMYKYEGLRLALAATNFGTGIKTPLPEGGHSEYDLPSMAKLGVGYDFDFCDDHRITASLEGDYLFLQNQAGFGIGAEYCYDDMVFVRGGYHFAGEQCYSMMPSYGSVGVGLKFFNVFLNAAYLISASENSFLTNTFNISIGYEF